MPLKAVILFITVCDLLLNVVLEMLRLPTIIYPLKNCVSHSVNCKVFALFLIH